MKTVEAADGKVSVFKLGKHLIFYQTYKSAPFFVQFIKSLHSNNLAPFLRHPSRGQVRWERRALLQLLQLRGQQEAEGGHPTRCKCQKS